MARTLAFCFFVVSLFTRSESMDYKEFAELYLGSCDPIVCTEKSGTEQTVCGVSNFITYYSCCDPENKLVCCTHYKPIFGFLVFYSIIIPVAAIALIFGCSWCLYSRGFFNPVEATVYPPLSPLPPLDPNQSMPLTVETRPPTEREALGGAAGAPGAVAPAAATT